MTKIETVVESAEAQAFEPGLCLLTDLQLALVGGGIGETTL